MRLLFAIPHFFDPAGEGRHGSSRQDADARVSALLACMTALHQNFGERQYMIDLDLHQAVEANDSSANVVDIVVCTTNGKHLLDQLPIPAGAYSHRDTGAESELLGFECQSVLREALGRYDYYCYMEDDLVIRDAWFFAKLRWFTDATSDAALLQPNRYELDSYEGGRKAYVDGNISPTAVAGYQDLDDEPSLAKEVLGRRVLLYRPLNPHAGCYFLNQSQMAHWAQEPHFLDRDVSFVGPLESAATLGIIRTFKIYKPAPECASFLELEHAHQDLADRLVRTTTEGTATPAPEG